MSSLLVMVGLPRSGKSYWSSLFVARGYTRVDGDEFRKALGVYPFVEEREPEVWAHVHVAIEALLGAGNKVVFDSVNHTRWARSHWLKYNPQYWVLRTPVHVCKARAVTTGQEYLVPVIDKMAAAWEEVDEATEGRVLYDEARAVTKRQERGE